jgi:hypothetical protein
MPEVERLLEGHTTVGAWSLAQICRHLATVLRRVVDLPASAPNDPSQWVGEDRKREVFESGVIPEGLPAPPEIVPGEVLGEREEAEGLRAALAHFRASPGPVVAHRFFGFLSREEWERLQCVHCAHHLSFAIPATASG